MSDYNNNNNNNGYNQNSDNNNGQPNQYTQNNQDQQNQNGQNQGYNPNYNGGNQNQQYADPNKQNGQNQGYSAPEYNQWNQNQQNYYQNNVPPQPPIYNSPPIGYQQKSRIAAGILGILFGAFGVHNFYIHKTNRAIAQLLLTILGGVLTCGIASVACLIWSFVEGILLLIGNDSWGYDGNGVIMKD